LPVRLILRLCPAQQQQRLVACSRSLVTLAKQPSQRVRHDCLVLSESLKRSQIRFRHLCTDGKGGGSLPAAFESANLADSTDIVQDAKRQMGIVFTCKVCSTRQARSFSRVAYDRGVVIIRCDGCQNLHLIADNLHWFDHVGGRNVEQILRERGEEVRRLSGCLDLQLGNKIESDSGVKCETEAGSGSAGSDGSGSSG
ncbi:hypothetical protein BOX15_Mlig020231g2, partial [Macrostomum lignano]